MTSRTRPNLSPHFGAAEFDCHDGTPWPPAARASLVVLCLEVLEPLRERFGPIRVTSGYRTPAYNRGVGGAPQSFHVYSLRYGPGSSAALPRGVAADVVPARGTPAAWQSAIRTSIDRHPLSVGPGRGAAVAYPRSGFVHADTGPTRSWAS